MTIWQPLSPLEEELRRAVAELVVERASQAGLGPEFEQVVIVESVQRTPNVHRHS